MNSEDRLKISGNRKPWTIYQKMVKPNLRSGNRSWILMFDVEDYCYYYYYYYFSKIKARQIGFVRLDVKFLVTRGYASSRMISISSLICGIRPSSIAGRVSYILLFKYSQR
jgi:hypothetical protein